MDKYPVTSAYKRDPVAKNYNEIVFRPHPSQSSELNDLQLIFNNKLKSIIDTQYKDGDILKGGFSNRIGRQLFFFDTTIYIRGQILSIPGEVVQITGVREEEVGILYREEYITANEDPELLDPAVTTANYRKRGADRVRYHISWEVNPILDDNSWFYPVCQTNRGEVSFIHRASIEDTETSSQLADYDYSTRGSYILNGVNLYLRSETEDTFTIGITSGEIRINGHRLVVPNNTYVEIEKPIETRDIDSDPINYAAGTISYKSRHYPITRIRHALGQQTVEEDITHRYEGSVDPLQYTPVIGVVSLTMLDKVYTSGIDFRISGDGIQWISSEQPSPGSTYHIVYNYFTDITSKIGFNQENPYEIVITDTSNIPDGTTIQVDYTILLSRKDVISITQEGNLIVTQGISAENNPQANIIPSSQFFLGTVELSAEGNDPILLSTDQRNLTISDQRINLKRLEECEYNIARIGLLMSLSAHQPSTVLKSNFVDPLRNNTKIDSAISSCSISEGYLGMKINWETVILDDETIIQNHTEETIIQQTDSTKSRIVNEYLLPPSDTALLEIHPNSFYFVKEYGTSSSIYNVPDHQIKISASGFSPNENILIEIENNSYTFKADSSGSIQQTIDITEIKSGVSKITARGISSDKLASSSYRAEALVQRQYVLYDAPPSVTDYNTYETSQETGFSDREKNDYETRTDSDSLAQTFKYPENRDITSVELYFTQKPTTNIFLSLTETTNGIPDTLKTLGRVMLSSSEVKINGESTKFSFRTPVSIEAEKTYAIIIGCNDNNAKISVAELGKKSIEKDKYISQNAYSDGTLVLASQLGTWTSVQAEDLKIKINAAYYPSPVTKKKFDRIFVSGVSDLLLLPYEKTPSNTSISANINLINSSSIYTLSSSSPQYIQSYTGDAEISYTLSSTTNKVSPIVYSARIGLGKIVNPSYYVSRQFPTGNGTTLFVYLTSLIPPGCTISVFYQELDGTWSPCTGNDPRYPDTNMGNNWIEKTYIKESFPIVEHTRIKIELYTSNSRYRPYCVDLRAVLV